MGDKKDKQQAVEGGLDTYCNLLTDRVQRGRTTTVYGENPVFNQEFELYERPPCPPLHLLTSFSNLDDDTQTLLVQLKDQNKKKNNTMGQVIIPVASLSDEKLTEDWYKMMPGVNTVILTGKVKLQGIFDKSVVRPRICSTSLPLP